MVLRLELELIHIHCCLMSLGLLRSVSRAVDLIMAHFGSSRDPEEKV